MFCVQSAGANDTLVLRYLTDASPDEELPSMSEKDPSNANVVDAVIDSMSAFNLVGTCQLDKSPQPEAGRHAAAQQVSEGPERRQHAEAQAQPVQSEIVQGYHFAWY